MPDVGSPEWWIARLYKKLTDRRVFVDLFSAYYEGDHPLPWLAPQAREEFRRVLRMTRSNYMGLVCDAPAEREQIEGFRFGRDGLADAKTWRLWQANNLDSYSDQAILEAHITGVAYMLVAPNPKDSATPFAWMEHPSQAIVEFSPEAGRRERAAGLKVWDDDWTGKLHATLYLPGFVYKFQADRPVVGATAVAPKWVERRVLGEEWPARNPLGEVPLVEIANRPRLLHGGVSEIADVIDIQDRINKTIADRLITQDYGAFPQKWAVAWPETDAQGNATPPIDVGRNRMITTEVKETQFGQFDAAPLDPYSSAKREDVKDIASRTRTPAQYLLGEMNNVNGETLKASESGLVSKVRQSCRTLGEDFETGVRLLRKAASLPDGDESMETIWRNPEFRTEGELTDSVVKKYQARLIPLRQAREDLGYTATQIQRMEEQDAIAAAADPLLDLSRPLVVDDAANRGG
jgi:hypothetical protein